MHRRSVAHNHPNKAPAEVVEKILHLCRTHLMGPLPIVWPLERYHDLETSDATVYRVCRRPGLRGFPSALDDGPYTPTATKSERPATTSSWTSSS